MGVRVCENQSGGDEVLAVLVQEIRDRHRRLQREIAGRWEQGLRGLFALTGFTALVGAPLAADHLAAPTQAATGVLLAVALLAAGTGIVLTMSAAYGSVRLMQPPATTAELQRLGWSLADRERRYLLWGRRLAVGALGLFAVSVAVAWLNPAGDGNSLLQVETNSGATYCGPVLDSRRGTVAVETDAEGRVDVPAAEVAAVGVVEDCEASD